MITYMPREEQRALAHAREGEQILWFTGRLRGCLFDQRLERLRAYAREVRADVASIQRYRGVWRLSLDPDQLCRSLLRIRSSAEFRPNMQKSPKASSTRPNESRAKVEVT